MAGATGSRGWLRATTTARWPAASCRNGSTRCDCHSSATAATSTASRAWARSLIDSARWRLAVPLGAFACCAGMARGIAQQGLPADGCQVGGGRGPVLCSGHAALAGTPESYSGECGTLAAGHPGVGAQRRAACDHVRLPCACPSSVCYIAA
eukprot:scaffold693_cov399-Prasinococcus_capsulatus_cf.AAC.28